MHNALTRGLVLAAVLFAAALAEGGIISGQNFSGDANSGISSANVYTHAVDVNGAGAIINGVTFVASGASGTDAVHGGGWSFSIPGQSTFANFNNNLTGNINQLARDFLFSSNPGTATETLTLTGLTPGTLYQAVFYSVGFGTPGTRVQNISDNQGGTLNGYDQNGNGSGNGSLLIDDYLATSNSITFTFTSTANNASFFQYGFSNQVVPEPGSIASLTTAGALVLLSRQRRVCER
jgi:hypothetical protein